MIVRAKKKKQPNMPMSVALDRLTDFDKRLMDLRAQGVPYKQIADILDKHERMLTSRMRVLSRLPATIDEEEAAKREAANRRSVGTAPQSVDEMSQRDKEMVRLYIDGEPLFMIAAELEVTAKTVSRRLITLRNALGTEVVPFNGDVEVRKLFKANAPQPATIPCMCCRRSFKSLDRMRNRICGHCKSSHAQIHDAPEERLCL